MKVMSASKYISTKLRVGRESRLNQIIAKVITVVKAGKLQVLIYKAKNMVNFSVDTMEIKCKKV